MGACVPRALNNSGHANGCARAAECTLSRSKTPPSTFQRELFLSIRQRGPWRRLRPHSISDLTRLRLLLTSVPSLYPRVAGGKRHATRAKAVWKTELCGKWGRGLCLHGERCMFAHGAHELQQRKQPRLVQDPALQDVFGEWRSLPLRPALSVHPRLAGDAPRARNSAERPGHERPERPLASLGRASLVSRS